MRTRAGGTLELTLLLGASLVACASAPAPVESSRPADVPGLVPLPPTASPPPAAQVATSRPAEAKAVVPPDDNTCPARVGPRVLKRSALNRTLDAGLGTWLRGVDVEPKIERGRFGGWLVRSLYAGDPCWADIDLGAGDVVNRVNRRPIEKPEEAQAVWTALRGTTEIVVDFVRAGRPKTLRFDVVDDPD